MMKSVIKASVFILLLLLASYAVPANAATYYFGGAKKTFPTGTTEVAAGYYDATSLASVISGLSAGNIKSGTTLFGIAGAYEGATVYTLTISTEGSGTVSKNPDSPNYYMGIVRLTASPEAGSSFDSWSGAVTGSANPGEIAMTGNKTVTAHFITIPTYALRDTGPAGGLIFYVDPPGAKLLPAGKTYLEAAPQSTEWNATGIQWSNITDNLIGASAEGAAIGSGESNTYAIIHQSGHTASAAKLCDDLVTSEGTTYYSDWFLPSKDELNLMYQNLKQYGVGGFGPGNYWSSTEFNATDAWILTLNGNSPFNYTKSYSGCTVRAVRAF